MLDPNFILLYVDNPISSAAFYASLLGKSPIESSPGFAMFALDSGVRLGLWSKHTVQPAATTVGGSEVAFAVADDSVVGDLYADWVKRGLVIAQTPAKMDFGYTFVALDADGHRLRVFAPSGN
jgi:hypothetical protein